MPPDANGNLTIDDVVAAVAAEDTEINAATAFIVSVPSLVAAAAASAGIDQPKALALVADIQGKTNELVAAISQGTSSAAPAATATTTAATAVAAMKKKLGIH